MLSIRSNSTTECLSWCSLSVFFPPWLEASCYQSSSLSPFEAANFLTLGLTQDCILSVLSYTAHRAVCCPLRVGRLWKTRHIINRRVNNFPQALLYQSLDMAAIDAWAVCVCLCVCVMSFQTSQWALLPASTKRTHHYTCSTTCLCFQLVSLSQSLCIKTTVRLINCSFFHRHLS